MARIVSFGAMKTRALQYADMVNSQFIADSELNDYINTSIADLYDQLVAAYGEDYFIKSAYLTTNMNQSSYDIITGTWWSNPPSTSPAPPEDFYKLVGIYRVAPAVYDAFNVLQTPERNLGLLNRWERKERFAYDTSWDTQWPKYRLSGTVIEFAPVPQPSLYIRIDYVPASPVLSDDNDPFDGINGWEDWACLDAAIKMMDKEEGDSRALVARRDRIEVRILQMAAARDANEPARVTDAYRLRGPYWDRLPPPV